MNNFSQKFKGRYLFIDRLKTIENSNIFLYLFILQYMSWFCGLRFPNIDSKTDLFRFLDFMTSLSSNLDPLFCRPLACSRYYQY